MARTFASGQRLSKASTLGITNFPATFAAWIWPTSLGASRGVICLYGGSGGANANFELYLSSTGAVFVDVGGVGGTNTSATVPTTTWSHVCGVFDSSQRTVFLNGANKAFNASGSSVSGLTTALIGSVFSTSNFDMVGQVAFPAIWNIALGDGDIGTLASGVHPIKVHPEALVGCPPLVSGASPEPDLVSSTGWTLTGTPTSSTNPRIYASP